MQGRAGAGLPSHLSVEVGQNLNRGEQNRGNRTQFRKQQCVHQQAHIYKSFGHRVVVHHDPNSQPMKKPTAVER